jgi:A/G-specific adenine glycosylase
MVRDDFDGDFPVNIDEMISLPGIGRSTAAAVLSIANNLPEVILDGNVKRVLGRYFAVEGYPGNKKVEDSMWLMAQSLKPESRFADYTQAIMDLGATLCTRSKPKCETCPVVTECLAYAQGRQSEFPHKKPKKQIPTKTTLMIVPFYQGSVLLEKRPLSGIWGGLYGMLETSDKDLDSSIISLIGNVAFEKRLLSEFTHTFSHFHLVITPIFIELQRPPEQTAHQVNESERLWYNIEQPSNVGLAAPTLKIFKQITNFI